MISDKKQLELIGRAFGQLCTEVHSVKDKFEELGHDEVELQRVVEELLPLVRECILAVDWIDTLSSQLSDQDAEHFDKWLGLDEPQ